MQTVILFVHLLIAMGLIGLVLMQRSEGGALGMGGGSNALMTGRGAADVLARGTMVLAGLFFVTSLTLSVLAGGHNQRKSVLEAAPTQSSQPGPVIPAAPPVRAGPLPAPVDPAAVAPQTPAPAAAAPAVAGPRPAAAAPVTAPPVTAAPAVKVAPAPTSESPRAMPAPTPPAAAAPAPLILTAPPAKPAEASAAAKPEPKPRAGPDE
jgi:preprotein translocase subunit SecG